jgi:hypothetical protein
MCVIDGEPRGSAGSPRSSAASVLNETWERAAESSRQVLQATTFAELTERAAGAAHGMYFI